MKPFQVVAAVALPVVLSGACFAQSNQQDVRDLHHQTKLDEKADKAQAKADKDTRKALKSHKVKKAAKSQDKADDAADKATPPR